MRRAAWRWSITSAAVMLSASGATDVLAQVRTQSNPFDVDVDAGAKDNGINLHRFDDGVVEGGGCNCSTLGTSSHRPTSLFGIALFALGFGAGVRRRQQQSARPNEPTKQPTKPDVK
jgi:MYXO-CTERM domain-containing protein